MDFEQAWHKALKNTEIVRSRVKSLMTTADTQVPYILLSESSINLGDTVVRKGEVNVLKPSIIVPPNNPQFKGFELGNDDIAENNLINFLIVRGVSLPSYRYNNHTNSLDIFEGKLSEAVKHFQKELQLSENVNTGLLIGAEDTWQFSILIFIASQIIKNADQDIRRLLSDYQKGRGYEENN